MCLGYTRHQAPTWQEKKNKKPHNTHPQVIKQEETMFH